LGGLTIKLAGSVLESKMSFELSSVTHQEPRAIADSEREQTRREGVMKTKFASTAKGF
jgi:hypothetical protein